MSFVFGDGTTGGQLWEAVSGGGLDPVAVSVSGDKWQDVWSEKELEALLEYQVVGAEYTMIFTATSTCNATLDVGFSGPGGGNGWLMTTIDAGSAAKRYAVTGECKDEEPTRYEIRDAHGASGCELKLEDVTYWTAACAPVDAFADVTAHFPLDAVDATPNADPPSWRLKLPNDHNNILTPPAPQQSDPRQVDRPRGTSPPSSSRT